jgi:cytochrome c-type biogenesis protein CcmH
MTGRAVRIRTGARRVPTLLCLAVLACPMFLLVAAALPSAAGASAGAIQPKLTLPSVEHEYMCVTCKIPLQVARSVQSSREREYLVSLIDDGLTKAQIKKEMISQYGENVLASPPAHGFDLAVYLVPLAVVLGLIALILTLLPAWRRHARAQAPTRVGERLDPSDTARLDADLARFD